MCEACWNDPTRVPAAPGRDRDTSSGPSRRSILRSGVVGVAALLFGTTRSPVVAAQAVDPVRLADGLSVRPRSSWAGTGRGPRGTIEAEPDVRVLLVHHSASPNAYRPDEVPGILQGFWSFHTGPEKGWPDIAYNFLIDRSGTIWEGRAGSIAGQVQGSATGGNQGYSQLICLIGNFESELPTAEAQESLVRMLAWVGERAGLDLSPGATSTFTSLGSNKHPAGAQITTPTIDGHRSMSLTSCPGDAFYPLVAGDVAPRVARLAGADREPSSSTSVWADPTTTEVLTEPGPSTSAATGGGAHLGPGSSEVELAVHDGPPEGGHGGEASSGPILGGGLVAMAAAGAAALLALRRRSEEP